VRIRTIKPEWLDDEALVLASAEARVLSIALILLADDYGNGRANQAVLAGRVFPGKNPDILANALAELATGRFVRVYEVDGQRYFSIRNWAKHQRVDKPGKPQVPEYTEVANIREVPANIPVVLATDQDQDRDQEGTGTARAQPTAVSSFERAARGPSLPLPGALSRADVERTFSELRVAAHRGSWRSRGYRDDERLDTLAAWANAEGTDRDSRLAALRGAILGFLADRRDAVVEARWGLAYLTDPGAYLVEHRKSGGGRPAPPEPTTELGRLQRERSQLAKLHGSAAFLSKTQAERIASIERLEAVERDIATLGTAS
jgi:hypothetical protein